MDVSQTTCSKDADLTALCALDESIDPIVCQITFIEQPWISKNKRIVENNCTMSQEFENHAAIRKNDESNEIFPHKGDNFPRHWKRFFRRSFPDLDILKPDDVHKPPEGHNFEAIAQTGNLEALVDPARLADLESQILLDPGTKASHAPPQAQPLYPQGKSLKVLAKQTLKYRVLQWTNLC